MFYGLTCHEIGHGRNVLPLARIAARDIDIRRTRRLQRQPDELAAALDAGPVVKLISHGVSDRSGDLAKRLLEHLGWLAAGNQMAVIDDDGRHRMNPLTEVKRLALAHFIGVLAYRQNFARAHRVKARLASHPNQHLMRSGALAVGEIGLKQALLQRFLPVRADEFCPMQ